jgi:two-component system, sensor histidine kinase and response regulator
MTALFDYDGAMQRMGNDEALFREMIHILREDAPRRFGEIERGLAAGDLTTVQRAAHSLKGLVANFGGERAQQAALHVEQLAKTGDAAGLPAGVDGLREEVRKLVAALEPLVEEKNRVWGTTA